LGGRDVFLQGLTDFVVWCGVEGLGRTYLVVAMSSGWVSTM
jgi:hypothetical protein